MRTRPLDAGPYTFVAAYALVLKVREGGRVVTCTPWWSTCTPLVVNVHALLATGVNADVVHLGHAAVPTGAPISYLSRAAAHCSWDPAPQ